ncbi:MAG TPA: hypothetical protein VFU41_15445 [Gemmatimonadales bacterium]|nr:hypothetical protein [Gemmatimonadales bacterium]
MNRAFAMLAGLLLLGARPVPWQTSSMTFFITSVGPGNGADLGGLVGADRHCHALADAVGAGKSNLQWRAYLSTLPRGGVPAVHARDRIGRGPWFNAKGVKVAENVADLHGDNNRLSKENSLTEKGTVVNGRGDQPNMHDILTGSQLDGTAYTAEGYTNCDNWSDSGGEGSARVGHHDRVGGGEHPTSWNSAHNSRGCSRENLRGTGGNGLFYCFGVGR